MKRLGSLKDRVARQCWGLARGWARDRRGLALVEFAFIAPVMILVVLSMADLSPALMAEFHVAHADESVADMAAEYTQLNEPAVYTGDTNQVSDMVNVMSVANDVLAPLPTSTLSLRVTSVYADGKGNTKVQWSCAKGTFAPLTANSAVTTTPSGNAPSFFIWPNNIQAGQYRLNGTNSSYIMSEVSYIYTPLTGYIIQRPITMTDTSYLLPRSSSYIGFPWDGNSSDAPAVPTATTTSATVTLGNGATCSYAK